MDCDIFTMRKAIAQAGGDKGGLGMIQLYDGAHISSTGRTSCRNRMRPNSDSSQAGPFLRKKGGKGPSPILS